MGLLGLRPPSLSSLLWAPTTQPIVGSGEEYRPQGICEEGVLELQLTGLDIHDKGAGEEGCIIPRVPSSGFPLLHLLHECVPISEAISGSERLEGSKWGHGSSDPWHLATKLLGLISHVARRRKERVCSGVSPGLETGGWLAQAPTFVHFS